MKRRTILASASAIALAFSGTLVPTMAQDKYPNRPVNVIVPLTPGITLDVLARLYAEKMTKILGQPVVVINRPGAGGIVGAQSVASALPDGYNLLMTNSGHVILPVLNKSLPFDPLKDFRGVSLVADAPAVVYVNANLGVKNLQEFIALAKSKPGTLNFGSAGIGSPTHIAGAYFAQQAGIILTHVPYKMSADIVSDLLGDRIQAVFAPPAYLPTMVKDGRLKALAISSIGDLREPFAAASARSQGVDYITTTWYGLVAPSKTPPAIVDALAKAMKQVSEDPEVKSKLQLQGLTANTLALGEFDAYMKKDSDRLTPLIKATDTN